MKRICWQKVAAVQARQRPLCGFCLQCIKSIHTRSARNFGCARQYLQPLCLSRKLHFWAWWSVVSWLLAASIYDSGADQNSTISEKKMVHDLATRIALRFVDVQCIAVRRLVHFLESHSARTALTSSQDRSKSNESPLGMATWCWDNNKSTTTTLKLGTQSMFAAKHADGNNVIACYARKDNLQVCRQHVAGLCPILNPRRRKIRLRLKMPSTRS